MSLNAYKLHVTQVYIQRVRIMNSAYKIVNASQEYIKHVLK
jgi:hypothetical protein